MLEQLLNLVKEHWTDAVVKNNAVPNEINDNVMSEASTSILDGLKDMVSQGKIEDPAGLLKGGNLSSDNPALSGISNKVSENLGSKFGLSSETTSSIASSLLPKVLGSLFGKAQDPNEKGFDISTILGALTGGNKEEESGLMGAISKYGGMVGLDQNGDGKVDLSDALSAVSGNGKKGGLGGSLGGLFGKK